MKNVRYRYDVAETTTLQLFLFLKFWFSESVITFFKFIYNSSWVNLNYSIRFYEYKYFKSSFLSFSHIFRFVIDEINENSERLKNFLAFQRNIFCLPLWQNWKLRVFFDIFSFIVRYAVFFYFLIFHDLINEFSCFFYWFDHIVSIVNND